MAFLSASAGLLCKEPGTRNGSVNQNNGVLDCVSGRAVQSARQEKWARESE